MQNNNVTFKIIPPKAEHRNFSLFAFRFSFKDGFSLLEMVVYVALLGMVMLVAINFMVHIVAVYQRARIEREVLSNARLVAETVGKQIAYARDIYAPTSRFNTALGQLSLVTDIATTTAHTSSFIDYYVDNGRFMTYQEGKGIHALSSPTVSVNQFRLERIMEGLGRQSVRFTLGVTNAAGKYTASTTISATATLRGNY